jgi:N-acetylglucosaminyldiphosphoundecaprenol N-acetyl-beta-D-mannosaminyltransferase
MTFTHTDNEVTADNPLSLAPLESRKIIDIRIDGTSYEDASRRIVAWAKRGEARYVTINSVNNVMEAHDDLGFRALSNAADLATPDGMPLVWALRRLGVEHATRTYGPILTPHVLALAEAQEVPVGFYGGTPEVLDDLMAVVARRWPALAVAYRYSPPFRPLTSEEDARVVREVEASGARILFVGIGCPRQEIFMAEHKNRLPVVQVGVGAAFDFLTERKRQAPTFIQNSGLEWLFRLITEPKRLWRRYLRHNPRFVMLFGRQLLSATRR